MTPINRTEVDTLIEQVNNEADTDTDLPEWDYWRDSGNYNCWLSDGWLLQVCHTYPYISLQNLENGKGAVGSHGNKQTGKTFIVFAIADPSAALDHLRSLDESLSYSSSTIIDEENGRAVSHFDLGSNDNEEAA